MAIVPRGWMILSLLLLVRQFFSAAATPAGLAVTFGGMLLALGALKKLTASLASLGSAAIAWEQVKTLFDAASRQESNGALEFTLQRTAEEPDESIPKQGVTLLEMRDLVFAHQGRTQKVLDGCSLNIAHGDRILLEGPSGGGKSTLVSLLTGLREPDSGLIMFRGLDWQTLGLKTWRRGVAAAPQFHENHILTGTLAFNLLMGRRWPAQPEDVELAGKVCRELGLGSLLDRMPAGLFQQVGETGWQLSYGERSRVFLARALLQGADVVILDESFGALDPETLHQAMDCVRSRAETLVVTAHP
jgi:ATP-binding cassette subfamily B protein